jgi:L-ascorbate metabolism protein UlaG (beta-lactamase superfamily)
MVEIALEHKPLLDEVAATAMPAGRGAFWWLGQHSFIVKAGWHVFYFDPWFDADESRQTRPLLSPDDPHAPDLVLISHGHRDHLSSTSLAGIAKASPRTLFVCPKTEIQRLREEANIPPERIRAMNAGERLRLSGIRVSAIKSRHEFFDEDLELGFPYLGYVVEAGGVAFYHSGDTIPYEGQLTTLKRWKLDAAFLPINGRDAERFETGCMGNLTFQEAAELAGDLAVRIAVPSHYDMFVGNQEDPKKFVRFLEAKYPGAQSWVGKAGERVWFPR